MSFIIDLVIIGIILLCTFIGYRRGLIKIAFSLCTFIIALIIALILYQPVSNIVINNTQFDENIANTITSNLLPENMSEENSEKDSEVDLNIPSILLENGANTVKEISNTLSVKIIETIVMLLIYIIAKIALKFVTFLADLIAKLPILNQFNKLGGTIYGVLQGILLVLVCFTVISLISPMLDTEFINNINNSTVGSFVYNNNILLSFIVK